MDAHRTEATGLAARDTGRTPHEVHASLMHIDDALVRKSNAIMRGYDLGTHRFDASDLAYPVAGIV